MITIKEITNITTEQAELVDLFQEVVASGAAMNFLHPMSEETAIKYWNGVLSEHVRLFVALLDEEIVGTVQLQMSDKENAPHRAEIAKLMTHPKAQRKGVARTILQHVLKVAEKEKRTLLLLDTEKEGPANALYQSEGFVLYGEIPAYSQDPFGVFKDGNCYYKYSPQTS
ncbi:GNAT family N-acetyltransferase [Marinilactibacillus sp. Marseille-P9653]|uniref:GNAT family N-acetyltransferase n=1 Tax=Marinilactibacillus sp. Marseille-P9653 TaxID=2866583 RepID=UPI001CE3E93F|nr:GNAT family N-acetyltransferase [Marinilactibacillus sp. Marseille-P9653]